MLEVILISIIVIALAVIAIYFHAHRKGKRIVISKTMFAAGLIIALVAALMMFCQERCFLGIDLEGWPTVLGIIGIGLIATSNYRLFMDKKK